LLGLACMDITINGKLHNIPPRWLEASLLTVLRDYLNLSGTKFGCGKGICGACTVHLDGVATRSCTLPVTSAEDSTVTTIEGLSVGQALHPVQLAWIEESVPQCGYCQSGQMMTAAAFLSSNPEPTPELIKQAMRGNLCRCGTYTRIRRAVARASEIANGSEL